MKVSNSKTMNAPGVVALGLVLLLASALTIAGSTNEASAANCAVNGQGDARRSGNVATVSSSSEVSCDGAVGASSSSDRWVAYCGALGDWVAGSSVEISFVEEVVTGTPTPIVGGGSSTGLINGPVAETFRWSVKCTSATGTSREFFLLLAGSEVPVDPMVVRQAAEARLVMPDLVVAGSPPLDDPDRFSVVRIPTWLWIEHPWLPMSETESDGGVTVTVTATPTKVTWDPGDGNDPFVCDDAGTAWRRGMKESDADCFHVYTRSSAGQPDNAFQLTSTVEWVLTWSVNSVDQGPYDTYEPSLTFSHRVGEILSVSASRPG